MTLTLEDIARLCGVSRSTVSRVINGDEKVSDETRSRVQDTIKKNNFRPNIAARRLAAGRTNVIGFVIPTGTNNIFNDPYFSRLIQGVSLECNAREYSLMLWLTEPEFERRMIRQIINNGLVDGVVVSSTLIDDPILSILNLSNMPFVLIGHHPTLSINSVDIDNFLAVCQSTTHMLSCAKKRNKPAIIAGPQNTMAGKARFIGYQKALDDAGIRYDPQLFVEADFTEAGGYSAMQKLLHLQPDAVFASNDLMAAGAYHAIREAGLKIPEDIAVIGFDDITVATQLDPALTTTRQPTKQMGSKAVELLIEIIRKPDNQPKQIIIHPDLIIRASCGCNSDSLEHLENK